MKLVLFIINEGDYYLLSIKLILFIIDEVDIIYYQRR